MPAAVALVVATMTFLGSAASWAVESARADAAVAPVSYSTGKQGSQLAWLPYRPSAAELRRSPQQSEAAVASAVTQAQYQTPAAGSDAGPMSDPFGDRAASDREPSRPAVDRDNRSFNPLFVDPTTAPGQSAPPSLGGPTGLRPVPATNIPPQLIEQGRGETSDDVLGESGLRALEEEVAARGTRDDGCPKTDDFKPINELTTDVRATSGRFPKECMLEEQTFTPRTWTPTTFTWKASGLCHKPLYFEDVQLERYGHSWGPYLQPIISHGHFFVTVPVLPYFMGVNPPNECLYTLGYYRPGSCAPYMLDPLPISVRGALWQAGAVVGAAAIVP